MAIMAKAVTGNNIFNGLVTVSQGDKAPANYNPGTPHTQTYASGDSLISTQNINRRYKLHGGVSGSGQWEH